MPCLAGSPRLLMTTSTSGRSDIDRGARRPRRLAVVDLGRPARPRARHHRPAHHSRSVKPMPPLPTKTAAVLRVTSWSSSSATRRNRASSARSSPLIEPRSGARSHLSAPTPVPQRLVVDASFGRSPGHHGRRRRRASPPAGETPPSTCRPSPTSASSPAAVQSGGVRPTGRHFSCMPG